MQCELVWKIYTKIYALIRRNNQTMTIKYDADGSFEIFRNEFLVAYFSTQFA